MARFPLPLRAVAAVLAAGAVGALGAWGWRRRRDCLRFRTMFGPTRIYEVADDEGCPVRLLEVNGIVQSGTYVEGDCNRLVFEYLRGYDLMFEAGRPVRDVCVLGCGGYDYPKHLIARRPGTRVTAVEVDPAITQAARTFFFLDRLLEEFQPLESGRLRLMQDDALAFLRGTDQRFDAIVNDAFDGGTPPPHLCGRPFLEAVRGHLASGGLYLTNIVAPLQGPGARFLDEQRALMGSLFPWVYTFPCDRGSLEEPDNIIVVATDSPLPAALAARSL